jgi:hypothetical protein
VQGVFLQFSKKNERVKKIIRCCEQAMLLKKHHRAHSIWILWHKSLMFGAEIT